MPLCASPSAISAKTADMTSQRSATPCRRIRGTGVMARLLFLFGVQTCELAVAQRFFPDCCFGAPQTLPRRESKNAGAWPTERRLSLARPAFQPSPVEGVVRLGACSQSDTAYKIQPIRFSMKNGSQADVSRSSWSVCSVNRLPDFLVPARHAPSTTSQKTRKGCASVLYISA